MSNFIKINITTIKYDENLKAVLTQARNEINPKDLKINYNIKKINVNGFETYYTKLTSLVFETQQKLRDFYQKNKNKLNFENTDEPKKYIKPNYYAFEVAYICDYNNCYSWEDITNELKLEEFKRDDGKEVDITEYKKNECQSEFRKIEGQCCCSKQIKIFNFISSSKTGFSLITGEDCINKNLITNKKIQDALNTLNDKRKKFKKEKERLSKIEELKKEGKHFCIDCVKVLEERWKSRCLRCYKKFIKS